ncbi:003L [Cherax quadricarinatus iridovirus]|uniref:Uncharacterized protein n=1 Tax=Shrimp hemocyte iridescent virus TaxID=2039780 RepID=A0A291B0Y7_9VIRU|nr:003L [Cherax quadricarinatus iridovirus]YP_010084899.1 hypothetical protein KM509_gp147 [Shrimp hemocyte iridescent virus]UPA43324.1 hypothetical protein 4TH000050 [Iridovirus CN01]ASZ84983.1 003L [Cherax quadricarinatus iridovirus]ATE87156.1 hypothetical protein [Shrimp hemocyte iridescent virus]UPA43559.1 hypothetical protein 3TG000126 [Iridovirus CN01]UPA43594.1 hypothetical protein 1DG000002 [Iridovirus CN01]
MEFDYLVEFFDSLTYAKRKYPILVTYNCKHLKKLTSPVQDREVKLFKKFLVQNQEICDRKLTNSLFQTGKQTISLEMNNFIKDFSEETVDGFWESLQKVEKAMFPCGKPTEVKDDPADFTHSLMESFKGNSFMSDILGQLSNIENLDSIESTSEIMNDPKFQSTISDVIKKIQAGKYNIKDVSNTLKTTISSINDKLDDETRSTLSTISKTVESVERGEFVDMNSLLGLVKNMKLAK